MKDFARQFYSSKQWADCRRAYRKSVGGLCERCTQQGRITAGVIVHHKVPVTRDNIDNPEITLSWNNLQLLCRDCHTEIHGFTHKRWRVDSFGRVAPRSA